ncbi:MAG: diguanylate cyclase [Synergistaceae bacterium]|nr:diguanylate cyclase [Synergistaceae bacterium]
MWKLFKYLLACYPTPVTLDKLIEAVWSEDDAIDPGKNVRDVIYRLRRTFTSLGSKQEYIIFTNGCYLWNPNAKCMMDFVEFKKYLYEAEDHEKSEEERISCLNAAISLYKGEFMGEKWSFLETWASYFVTFYKRLFLNAVESLSNLYEQRLDYESIITLHNNALLAEPFEESLYARLIQILIKNGEYALAERQYRQIEKFFSKEFDAPPPQTLQDLYEESVKASVRKPAALARIKELFDERADNKGPMLCAPDTFTQIYSYGKRVDDRLMLPVFLGKVTLTSDEKKDLTKAELEQEMKTVLRILLSNLRKGDIICRYSPNQFLMMLTTTKNTNLKQGMQRIDSLFRQESDVSQTQLEIEIIPLKDVEMEQS